MPGVFEEQWRPMYTEQSEQWGVEEVRARMGQDRVCRYAGLWGACELGLSAKGALENSELRRGTT